MLDLKLKLIKGFQRVELSLAVANLVLVVVSNFEDEYNLFCVGKVRIILVFNLLEGLKPT